jgi:hypothetical protein
MSARQPLSAGMPVTVRTGEPSTHCRTPHYLRGKRGVVVRALGRYPAVAILFISLLAVSLIYIPTEMVVLPL